MPAILIKARDAESVKALDRRLLSLSTAAIRQRIDQSVHLLGRINDVFRGQVHGDFNLLPPPTLILGIADGGFERIEFNCGSARNPQLHRAGRFAVVGKCFDWV